MQKEIITGFRVSPQQKHLWLLQQVESKLPYRAQCAVEIQGNLNKEIFEAALEKVWHSHEILRTTFRCLPGTDIPLQVISDRSIPSISQYSLTELTPTEQDAKIEEIFEEISQQPFDEKGQLWQIVLIELSLEKYQLIVSLSALGADTLTLDNLVRKISEAYAAVGQETSLFETEIQYADISEVFNDLIESEDTKAGKDYWQKFEIYDLFVSQLVGEKELDRKSGFTPKKLTVKIPQDLATKIEAIAQNSDTSVPTFLLTCWQILLSRLTGVSNAIVGTYCDGRTYEGLESSLGLFAKYLPLTCQVSDTLEFSEVLQQVSELIGNNYEWQEYFTSEQITAATGKGATDSFIPFCFELEPPLPKYSAGGLSWSIAKRSAYISRFKVKLSCRCQDDALICEFHYDANLFPVADIGNLAEQFQTLLASAANNPKATTSGLAILSDRARQQLLVEFNNTKTAGTIDKCVHQLFEEQVKRTPDRTAAVFESQQLTYAELNAQANQLAHYLQQQGVGPEVLVGICAARSLSMLVGVLGILKAGGAYVPIDSTIPRDRQAFILTDSQVPVLLTQQHLVADLPTSGIQVICLDADWEIIASEPAENPTCEANSHNLAYAIYTSGSTGKPKGTLILHQGLTNYLTWCTQAYAVEAGTGTLVHSPLGFDLTVTSLFSPLLVGSRVELLPENQGIETLCTALRRSSNLSLVKITPAHLELLAQQIPPQAAAGLTRAFIIGGENLLASSVAFWQENAPDTLLVNEYGPTETVVGCCVYQVPGGEKLSGSIPIGRAIANTQLYVLDGHLQPVPIGVAGELHIGGLGVARGYLNRPDLNAEKFIANPFSDEPGSRLYKTGDRARYRSDGTLEFLGRLDDQVKIRGYRIELGEIEAVLLEHSGVQEAVVLVQEDGKDRRLVAYIVLNQESPAAIGELNEFLKEKLPEYMIPSVVLTVPLLPLTANGKVDRRSLLAMEAVSLRSEVALVLPSNSVESAIANVWQDVLQVERVSIHDNFFDIGGHSLLLAEVHRQLREILKADLSLIELLEYPTIYSLAKHLSEEQEPELEFQSVRDRVGKQKSVANRQKQLRMQR